MKNQNNKLAAALERANSAETKVEKLPRVFEELGIKFFRQRLWSDAVKMFDSALVLNPQSAKSHFYKANALTFLKEYEDAANAYDFALDANDPTLTASVHLRRGLLNVLQDRFVNAKADLELAVEQLETAILQQAEESFDRDKLLPAKQLLYLVCHSLSQRDRAAEIRNSLSDLPLSISDGALLCIEALHHLNSDSKPDDALDRFFQALRWFEYRLSGLPPLENKIAMMLIDQCSVELAVPF